MKGAAMGSVPADRRFVVPDDVETMVFDWGLIKWLSEVRVTGSGIAAGVVILAPGKGHLRHNHPGSEEVLYYLAGEGEQMIEDDDGKPIVRHVRAGEMAYIPEGVYHGTENTGSEPMHLLAVYSPGGPEAILRAQPDCVTVPPGAWPALD
jgi:oxalate decarboxylase/phosphoglucose isomerase-like protein (cupin superfamily)